jgi:hypothetical protein
MFNVRWVHERVTSCLCRAYVDIIFSSPNWLELEAGWQDCANFCLLGENHRSTCVQSKMSGLLFTKNICINFDKKRIGLPFGQFFHKIICLAVM